LSLLLIEVLEVLIEDLICGSVYLAQVLQDLQSKQTKPINSGKQEEKKGEIIWRLCLIECLFRGKLIAFASIKGRTNGFALLRLAAILRNQLTHRIV